MSIGDRGRKVKQILHAFQHIKLEKVITWLLIGNMCASVSFAVIACLHEWHVMVSMYGKGDGDDGSCLGRILKIQ